MAIRITGAGVALTVGIIILAGLIIGGLFWVKETGEQARRDEAVQIAEEKLENESGNDVALNEDEAKRNESERSSSEGTPAEEGVPPSDESTDETESNGTEQSSDEMAQAGRTESEEVAELPQTGPADAGAFVVLGATTFMAAAYHRSRRLLLEHR